MEVGVSLFYGNLMVICVETRLMKDVKCWHWDDTFITIEIHTNVAARLYLGNKSHKYTLCLTNLGRGNLLLWE